MTTCPRCGYDLTPDLSALDPRHRSALDALYVVILRNGGTKPTTQAVAVEMGYSTRWAYEFLRALERQGIVARHSPKTGWYIPTEVRHALQALRLAA